MTTIPVVQFTIAGIAPPPFIGAARPYVLVYDGTCRVCTRLAKLLRSWDRPARIEVLPSQSPGIMARFPWIPPQAYAQSIQLIGPGGRTWQGAVAIEQLLNLLPKGRLLSWVFLIPFVRPLADRFYRWFARNRYKLGCGDHCQSRPLNVIFEEAERADAASGPGAMPQRALR